MCQLWPCGRAEPPCAAGEGCTATQLSLRHACSPHAGTASSSRAAGAGAGAGKCAAMAHAKHRGRGVCTDPAQNCTGSSAWPRAAASHARHAHVMMITGTT